MFVLLDSLSVLGLCFSFSFRFLGLWVLLVSAEELAFRLMDG